MYREHLTNFNTAAIYDDIYENIGGYKHLCPPAQLSRGPSPPAPAPLSLRPCPYVFNAPAEGDWPWNWIRPGVMKKLEWWGYQAEKKVLYYL